MISSDNSYNCFKSFFKIVFFAGLPIKNTSEHYISSHSYSLKLDSTSSPILQERSWASVTSRQTPESVE